MSLEYIFILATVCIIGLGFVLLALFGLRNLTQGKHSMFSIVAMFIPLVVFGICYAITGGDLPRAAILAMISMIAIGTLGLLVSGIKGLTT